VDGDGWARHRRVSAFLISRNTSELAALVASGHTGSVGIGGGSARLDVEGVPEFAKRIPLTRTHPRSTANLFNLPPFCQYGIGSTAT
jgi:hypothetical protein